MKKIVLIIAIVAIAASCNAQPNKAKVMKNLTPQEKHVIIDKGTERAFTGEYNDNKRQGVYLCKQCGAALYRSQDKFDSGCGWPAFDDQIAGAVTRTADPDGRRTEITCTKCGGHLGHVFLGEELTDKNTRHCVNSISMDFVANTQQAIFAGGCFWGVEHLMQQQDGVLSVESGYIGGSKKNPTYKEVCTGQTGHAEAVRILFDPAKVSYQTLAKLFFEIHDPTQSNGQGPDIGNQYRSEVFYTTEQQKIQTESLIAQLRDKGYKVATTITKATEFFPAEQYHQNYYEKNGKQPYCHSYTKRF